MISDTVVSSKTVSNACRHALQLRGVRTCVTRPPTVVSVVGNAQLEEPFPPGFFTAPPSVTAGGTAMFVVSERGGEQRQAFSYGRGHFGELGHGISLRSLPSPTKLFLSLPSPSDKGVAEPAELQLGSVVAGVNHTFFLSQDGRSLLACGSAQDSQLGLNGAFGPQGSYHGGGQPLAVFDPVAVPLPEEAAGEGAAPVQVAALSASKFFSLMLTSSGNVYVTGSGFAGELGLGRGCTVVTGWQQLASLPAGGVARIGAGKTFAAAVTKTGQLYVWGALGTPGVHSTTAATSSTGAVPSYFASQVPVEVALPGKEEGSDVSAWSLACGYHHLVVSDSKRVWTFGLNANGALGTGGSPRDHVLTGTAAPLPLQPALTPPLRVAAGPYASAVLGTPGGSGSNLYVTGRLDVAAAALGTDYAAAVAAAVADADAAPAPTLLRGLGSSPDGLQLGAWSGTRELAKAEPVPGRPVTDIAFGVSTMLAALA